MVAYGSGSIPVRALQVARLLWLPIHLTRGMNVERYTLELDNGDTLYRYPVPVALTLPGEAPERFADLTTTDRKNGGCRVIGGDYGDLWHCGYTAQDGQTTLYQPDLISPHSDLSEDEVIDTATDILLFAFSSIGWDCITH